MVIIKEAPKGRTIDEVVQQLEAAIADEKWGMLGMVDLKQKMNDKGVDFSRDCRVIEVCQPTQAKRVLESNMAISTAMPCRISVYERGGSVKVAMLQPTALLNMFNDPDLEPVAQEVEQAMLRMMDRAVA